MRAVIFDIDGTLADVQHRLHHLEGTEKSWPAFFEAAVHDEPIEPIVWLARELFRSSNILNHEKPFQVLVVTARPDSYREPTLEWLNKHKIFADGALYMRKEGDYRADNIVKQEILQQILEDGYEPFLVVDDRPQVVEMWRAFGLTCLQCAPDEPVHTPYTGMTLLHMMVGPAGAGKSTYVEEHYEPHVVVSTDRIRLQYNLTQHPDDMARTWKLAHGLIKARLEAGFFTVLDATNLKRKDRLKVLAQVPKGVLVQYVLIDRDYDQKLKSRGWRSEELVSKHHKAFKAALPDLQNCDDQPNVMIKDVRTK